MILRPLALIISIFFFTSLLLNSQLAHAQTNTLPPTPQNIGTTTNNQIENGIEDEIKVFGERTGPRLWRIEKGEAETFVLVGVSYIPRDMEWNNSQVAQVLEEAEEVLLAPDAQLGAGNNARIIGTLLRTMIFNRGRIMMKKGLTLADKIDPALAAAYEDRRKTLEAKKLAFDLREKAKEKAKKKDKKKKSKDKNDDSLDDDFESDEFNDEFGNNQDLTEEEKKNNALVEKQIAKLKPARFHPYMQAGNLTSLAIQSEGLSGFGRVERNVKKLARKAKVKTRPIITLDVAFADIKKVLKSMKSFSRETNEACISEAIQFVDEDLPKFIGIANAWALGDVGYIKANLNESTSSECSKAVSDELGGLKTFDGSTIEEVDLLKSWVDELVTTMEQKPKIRLAIIPANTWLREDGALDRLEARGFTIYGPRRNKPTPLTTTPLTTTPLDIPPLSSPSSNEGER